MFRQNTVYRGRLPKLNGEIHLSRKMGKERWVKPIERETASIDGEKVVHRGKRTTVRETGLKETLSKMENPVIWVWHPWRKVPEVPQPELPVPNAIKNLHGAIVTGLSTVEKRNETQISYGAQIPPSRSTNFTVHHPFMAQILAATGSDATGFPFYYKKYPTRRHAYEYRFSVPAEMLIGYPQWVKDSLGGQQMNDKEIESAESSMYAERYAMHDLDTGSLAYQAACLAVRSRRFRNIVLQQPFNNFLKIRQNNAERLLLSVLFKLRKTDFRKYWEIVRDHDIMDIIQPNNAVEYRWGGYWRMNWNQGLAISTPIGDFMDPRGMNGCVETGRSRAEVARDLGLNYSRPLTAQEKKKVAQENSYHERLRQFKEEQPAAWREKEREQFITKYTAMFTKLNKKNTEPNWASKNRHLIGTKVLRFGRKRP